MKEIQEEVKAALGKAQEEIKKYANKKRAEIDDYKVGITNGHLLICDWCFRILKGSKIQSLDSNKRCC